LLVIHELGYVVADIYNYLAATASNVSISS